MSDIAHVKPGALLGNAGSTIAAAAEIPLGTGLSFSNGQLTASGGAGSGTVTSVTFTGDGTVLSSTPSSAVTTSGTVTGSLATQSANTMLCGPTSGSAAAPTFRLCVAADLPTTGLTITQHAGLIYTDTPSAGAVTVDFSVSDKHTITAAASTTVTLSNPTAGQIVTLILIQSGTGSDTWTFAGGTVDWGAAGAPTFSTSANAVDVVVMLYNGSKYLAGVFGLGF